MYMLARILEILDLAIVFAFGIGFFIPYRFIRTKFAHMCLTWVVLLAQLIFGLNCPILMWANHCRLAAGAECIDTHFQPTFLNFLASFLGHWWANAFMLANIFCGPLVATALFVRKRRKLGQDLRTALATRKGDA